MFAPLLPELAGRDVVGFHSRNLSLEPLSVATFSAAAGQREACPNPHPSASGNLHPVGALCPHTGSPFPNS